MKRPALDDDDSRETIQARLRDAGVSLILLSSRPEAKGREASLLVNRLTETIKLLLEELKRSGRGTA